MMVECRHDMNGFGSEDGFLWLAWFGLLMLAFRPLLRSHCSGVDDLSLFGGASGNVVLSH